MSNSFLISVLTLAFGLVLNVSARATTLGDVAGAIAAPSGAAQATNDWTSFAKLKGVKWKGSAPAKGGNTHYWNGDTTIDGLGRGGISTSGSKTAVTTTTATVNKLVDRNKLPQLLAAQFPRTRISKWCVVRVRTRERVPPAFIASLFLAASRCTCTCRWS